MGEPTDFKTPCTWPGCGEIDIMEYVGGTGWMKTNFCHPRGGNAACSWGKEWCTCDWNHVSKAVNKTWADEFHTCDGMGREQRRNRSDTRRYAFQQSDVL